MRQAEPTLKDNGFSGDCLTPGEGHDVHCDDLIDDLSQPEALRRFLHYKRLPAVCQCAGQKAALKYIHPELHQHAWTDPEPVCFADYEGRRVRLVMASRFGDVGITSNLSAARGYERRVSVSDLSNFSEAPHPVHGRDGR